MENGKSDVFYEAENGLTVREITIDSGNDAPPVIIAQITDAHIAFREHERQNWETCLRYAAQAEYVVATGDLIEALEVDLLAYLKNSVSQYPNVLLSLGNHDLIPTPTTPKTMEERYALLQAYWPNDVVYSSVVVGNKAMLIQLDNSREEFSAEQLTKLQADLLKARAQGYAVVLFHHIPFHHLPLCATPPAEGESNTTRELYTLICSQADIIKGAFCGHLHDNYTHNHTAKTPLGEDAVIPQYISRGTFSNNGHITKIIIK